MSWSEAEPECWLIARCPFIEESEADVYAYKLPVFILLVSFAIFGDANVDMNDNFDIKPNIDVDIVADDDVDGDVDVDIDVDVDVDIVADDDVDVEAEADLLILTQWLMLKLLLLLVLTSKKVCMSLIRGLMLEL